MKSFLLSLFIIILGLFQTGCTSTFYVTHKVTHEKLHIKTNKIRAVITAQGFVYEKGITFSDTSLTVYGTLVPWNTIRKMELNRISLGDILAVPLEVIGASISIIGLLSIADVSLSDNNDNSPSIFGEIGAIGSGILIQRIGHSMRPKEKNTYGTIFTSEYRNPTKKD